MEISYRAYAASSTGFVSSARENGRSPETLDVIGRLPNRCSERCGDLFVKTVDLLAHDDDSRLAMTVDNYAIAVFDGKIHDLPEGSFGKCKFGKDIDSLFR